MGAPSPDLSNLWLARAFNAQDVEVAAALYHPDAAIVQVDEVHGGTTIARGADGIRSTGTVTVIGVFSSRIPTTLIFGLYTNEQTFRPVFGAPEYYDALLRLTPGIDGDQAAKQIKASLVTKGVQAT